MSFPRGGFFLIILALGLVSVLGVLSLTLTLFSITHHKKRIELLNRKEAYYSSELAAWHGYVRSEAGLPPGEKNVQLSVVSASEGDAPNLPPDDFNPTSYLRGMSVNFLTTKSYVSHSGLIRRYVGNNLGYRAKGNGLCGATTYNQWAKQYNVCLMSPAGAPQGSCVAGKTLTDISGGNDIIRALAIAKDGKMVAGGTSTDPADLDKPRWVIARFNTDRSLDKSFNGTGFNLVQFNKTAQLYAITLQNDGKIVAVGSTKGVDDGDDWVIGRFLTNGSLDTSFDGDGLKIIDPSGVDASASAVTIQTVDGLDRILVAGSAPPSKFALGRFNADGSTDTQFNGGQMVLANAPESPRVIRVLPDNKIRIGGVGMFAQYSREGKLDETFGNSGVTVLSNTPSNFFKVNDFLNLTALSDFLSLSYLITLPGPNFKGYYVLSRYNSLGQIDHGYGEGGTAFMVTDKTGHSIALSPPPDTHLVGVQADNRVLTLFGTVDTTMETVIKVIRHDVNGQVDNSFGVSGSATVTLGKGMGGGGWAFALAVYPSGAIVGGGQYIGMSTTGIDMALVCFNPDGK